MYNSGELVDIRFVRRVTCHMGLVGRRLEGGRLSEVYKTSSHALMFSVLCLQEHVSASSSAESRRQKAAAAAAAAAAVQERARRNTDSVSEAASSNGGSQQRHQAQPPGRSMDKQRW